MVPPPWYLLSPTGISHDVPDAASLKILAKKSGLIGKDYKNPLAVLVGIGNHKALTDLPLHKLHWQLRQLLPPSLMAPSSAPLPLSSQPFSSCYLQMCGQCVCAVLASNCSHGSTQVRALGVLIPCGGFFLFSMTVDIMQVRTARATVLA